LAAAGRGALLETPRHRQRVENCWWWRKRVLNATNATGRFDDESL
jgi:hypothetical protein